MTNNNTVQAELSAHQFIVGSLWGQYGAAIDMLERAIKACPDAHWAAGKPFHQFWYLAFHTLFFLDYNTHGNAATYQPRKPFGITELDPEGKLPERVFAREELQEYLRYGRSQLKARLTSVSSEELGRPCPFPERKLTQFEFFLYDMRHVQHHTAQLNLMLRHSVDDAPGWIGKCSDPL